MPDAKVPAHTSAAVSRAPTTCGPWRVGRLANMQSGIARVDDRCGTPICYTEPMLTDEVANGNATLIAAAPELLAALRNLADAIEFSPPSVEREFMSARAAIAKAEGRS